MNPSPSASYTSTSLLLLTPQNDNISVIEESSSSLATKKVVCNGIFLINGLLCYNGNFFCQTALIFILEERKEKAEKFVL